MKDFWNFVLDNCILDFDAERVYLKPQVINLKNKEVTVKPKPQTLEKVGFSSARQSSRPGAGRSTDIRVECSADA